MAVLAWPEASATPAQLHKKSSATAFLMLAVCEPDKWAKMPTTLCSLAETTAPTPPGPPTPAAAAAADDDDDASAPHTAKSCRPHDSTRVTTV